jgi:tetratricopeptide (TPR) repeat protein
MTNRTRYQPGDTIEGRYWVYQSLSGGMGEVYLCFDSYEEIPIALKTFQSRYVGNTIVHDRFKGEVSKWITLGKHPNIVRCYAMDILDGLPFIVMEWVAGYEGYGTDLRGWLRRGPLGLKLALDFAIDICRGLIHANNMQPGIVHRDLKPDNILVTQARIAKITDFGLAKIATEIDLVTPDRGSQAPLSLTCTGGVVGTPAYMAPEQWRGEKNLDVRTDIYAVGCILYEMLTGRRPFSAATMDGLSRQHTESPVPDATRYVSLPTDLDPLIKSCMAKRRDERFSTVEELLDALSHIYRQEFREEPRPILPSEELNAWDYINRAETYSKLQRYDAALADYDEALRLNPDEPLIYIVRAGFFSDWTHYDEAIEDLDSARQLDPDVLQFFLWHLIRAIAQMGLNDYDAAMSNINRAIELEPNVGISYAARGGIYVNLNLFSEALEDLERAIELDPDNPLAYLNRGAAYNYFQRYDEAMADIARAFELVPYLPPSFSVVAYVNRGGILLGLGRYDEALEDLNRALEIDPSVAKGYAIRGALHTGIQQHDQALSDYNHALEIDPGLAQAHLGRGTVYIALQRFEDAQDELEQALALDPDMAMAYIELGRLYSQLGRHDDALASLNHAIEIQPGLAIAYATRGSLLNMMLRPQEALIDLDRAIGLAPKLWITYIDRANVYLQLQQIPEAMANLDRVLEIVPHLPPMYDAMVRLVRSNAYLALDDFTRALSEIDQVMPAVSYMPLFQAAQAYYLRGLAFLGIDSFEKAFENFDRAIQSAPHFPQGYFGMGITMISTGHPEQADSYFQKAIELGFPPELVGHGQVTIAYGAFDQEFEEFFEAETLAEMYFATTRFPKLAQPGAVEALRHVAETIIALDESLPEEVPPEFEAEFAKRINWLQWIIGGWVDAEVIDQIMQLESRVPTIRGFTPLPQKKIAQLVSEHLLLILINVGLSKLETRQMFAKLAKPAIEQFVIALTKPLTVNEIESWRDLAAMGLNAAQLMAGLNILYENKTGQTLEDLLRKTVERTVKSSTI